MSDTILSGDFTVYYLAETRRKQIIWTGSANGTRTVKELYSAMANLMDELTQMDDGSALSAQTPTEYTIGIIDPSDKDPWFIDRTTAEHLTGGALKTASWKRIQDSNIGIVKVACTNVDIVAGDIGNAISHQAGDTGTLVDAKIVAGAGNTTLWIRPTNYTVTHNWDSTSGTITCNGHTATQTTAALTGETLWANIYSLGTIETYTHLFVYQLDTKLAAYKGTVDWWTDGHFDILVMVKEVDAPVDQGYITVFARQYGKTFDNYIVNLTTGGRNPIPLATGVDSNNETGYRQFTGSSGSGTFDVGNWIYVGSTWATATKRGRLTAVGGTETDPVLTYYLIGDLTDFENTDAVKEWTGLANGATCTASAPANAGPATYTDITITHANAERDVNENGTNENYSIVIACATRTVAQVYERTKYLTRRGETATAGTDGIKGERYIGSDNRIIYGSITGGIAEGDVVIQYSGGWQGTFIATGTVVAHHTVDKILILRNSRGTFDNTNIVYKDASNYVETPASTALAAIKAAPFGTFAGGKFFCSPGVVLDNIAQADLNKFQLIDDNGNTVVAPTKVTITVSNTKTNDRVAVFRLTAAGGIIKKDEYTIDSGQGAAGSTVIKVDPAITADTSGKTAGGIVRVIDTSTSVEHRYRYTGWATDEFTLFNLAQSVADAGSSSTVLIDAEADFTTVKVGDIIRNVTEGVFAYVVSKQSSTQITTTPVTDWTGDTYRVGVTVQAYATEDTVYVPFIDAHETADGSEEASITYLEVSIPVIVRVRQAGDILPFETPSTIGSTGMAVATIRTDDTIYE